jgi:hypothetical protein
VSRRPDPVRIYEAQRAGAVARLATRAGPERAELLVAGWELEAAARGIPRGDRRYWYVAEAWLEERVAA